MFMFEALSSASVSPALEGSCITLRALLIKCAKAFCFDLPMPPSKEVGSKVLPQSFKDFIFSLYTVSTSLLALNLGSLSGLNTSKALLGFIDEPVENSLIFDSDLVGNIFLAAFFIDAGLN